MSWSIVYIVSIIIVIFDDIKKFFKMIKVILTGATGMVGEGVLLECLQNDKVKEILSISRKSCNISHPKLKELLVSDFLKLEDYSAKLVGYDACFYCAGVSSLGMDEEKYTKLTYDTTVHFAKVLSDINPSMNFIYVSGTSTDSTEKGKVMWARVKGKTENDLHKLPFKGQYNFRPGFMSHFKEQKNIKFIFKIFAAIIPNLFPKSSLTLQEVGRAMINATIDSYPKNILEISDIKSISN
jgi:putative NADH-flavin reductase